MFHHFQHEREYCNSGPVLWVDGPYIIPLGVVTFHSNCASNICDHSASYFYSGVGDTRRQYRNIWDMIISHSHMHLSSTHLQCFQLLFQLSLLLPVKSQLLRCFFISPFICSSELFSNDGKDKILEYSKSVEPKFKKHSFRIKLAIQVPESD